jgi:hypothetical protein
MSMDIGPPRWVWKVAAVGLFAIWAGVGVFLVSSSIQTGATARETRKAILLQEQNAARTDCRSAIIANFDEVLRHADGVQRVAQLDLARYLLGNPASTSETLMKDASDLEAANQAIAILPKVDDAVDHGYRLNGITHGACPKVVG